MTDATHIASTSTGFGVLTSPTWLIGQSCRFLALIGKAFSLKSMGENPRGFSSRVERSAHHDYVFLDASSSATRHQAETNLILRIAVPCAGSVTRHPRI